MLRRPIGLAIDGGTAIRKLISLGAACETAFQLRQHSGDNTAHFFDWLFTPPQALIKLVRDDFPAFEPLDLRLMHAGTRKSQVIHIPSGIGFAHQFPRRGKVIPETFLGDYPAFASRIEYLAARFRATVAEHPVLLVRRGTSRNQALKLEEAMKRRFPSADMRFLYVNADVPAFETPLGRSARVPAPKTAFGDSLAWAAMLESEGLVEKPFRLAPAEIVRTNTNNQLEENEGHPLRSLVEGRRNNPDNPWFAYELGWKELTRRRYGRAARLANEAFGREQDNPAFLELKLRADLARWQVRRETALNEAVAAIGPKPHRGLSLLAADLLLALKRPREALDYIERGLAAHPYFDALQLRKARALHAAGRLVEAEEAVNEALMLHPQGKAHVELKANILRALGRTDEALDLVSDTLRSKRSYRLQVVRARLALGSIRRRGRRGAGASMAASGATTALGRVDSTEARH
jgi:tetratricopeptide (TPR) repeat protein